MTHDWNEFQWLVWGALNWWIAKSYFVIAHKVYQGRTVGGGKLRSLLFTSFIAFCGLHHLVHPVIMYALTGTWMFSLLVLEITLLAIISQTSETELLKGRLM